MFGEITFGASEYENEYTYNGESYNPNIKSQYLRARYYCVVTADFLTEDTYLGNIREPLTLNRYNYCVGNPVNYADPSGNWIFADEVAQIKKKLIDEQRNSIVSYDVRKSQERITFLSALHEVNSPYATVDFVMRFDYENRNNDQYINYVKNLAEHKNKNYSCTIYNKWVTLEMLTGEERKWEFKEIISYDLDTGLPTYGDEMRPVTEEDVLKINIVLNKYEINTPNRIAHFLAQCDIECRRGRIPVEQYNGSDIFKYFENYEKEGNGLGNTESGDGTRYRGAGAIQITGRAVYEALGTAMGNEKITSDGALYVAQNYFWESAGFYWKVYKPGTASDDRYDLNKKCDESETVDEDEIVKEITRIIKGSSEGYEVRKDAYDYYIKQLTGDK